MIRFFRRIAKAINFVFRPVLPYNIYESYSEEMIIHNFKTNPIWKARLKVMSIRAHLLIRLKG